MKLVTGVLHCALVDFRPKHDARRANDMFTGRQNVSLNVGMCQGDILSYLTRQRHRHTHINASVLA